MLGPTVVSTRTPSEPSKSALMLRFPHCLRALRGHTLPGGTFPVNGEALKDTAGTTVQRIQDEAEQVFKDITGDVNKWAGLVKSGVLTGADSALNNANSAFGKALHRLAGVGNTIMNTGQQLAKPSLTLRTRPVMTLKMPAKRLPAGFSGTGRMQRTPD